MDYKGYLIMQVGGWYEVDGLTGSFKTIQGAKNLIDRKTI